MLTSYILEILAYNANAMYVAFQDYNMNQMNGDIDHFFDFTNG